MFEALISRSVDLQLLQKDGFVMEACDGWLIIHHIPYLNATHQIKDGTLLMALTTAGNHTARPCDHTAYWEGERPCDISGTPLPSLINSSVHKAICTGHTCDYYLSCHAEKEEFPPNGDYPDYYQKVLHYFDLIAAPALHLNPDAWSLINRPIDTIIDNNPLQYMDTNASRAGITNLLGIFQGLKIGIIGMGGTGAYLLDLIAKIPVGEIHIFDADVLNNHNAFRAPGAISESELSRVPTKVEYYANLYRKMHRSITPHPLMITSDHFSLLDNLDYVFISIDSVSAKRQIADYLIDKSIPFIDSGLGIDQNPDGKLSGLLHITIGTKDCYQHLSQFMGSEKAEDDMYATNIQIAELNSLAATLSVIRWKKKLGFYADIHHECAAVYSVSSNEIDNVYETKEV